MRHTKGKGLLMRARSAESGIEIEIIDGVPIPFAGAELMLRMKKSPREKYSVDRAFLQKLIREQKFA
jgi:hypothetical protein